MIRACYQTSAAEALQLFATRHHMTFAGIGERGQPVLRTVDHVLLDGDLYFHGGAHGEKVELLGKPAVASVEQVVAEIPSHFLDPERACPSTTYFESAMAHGVLEALQTQEEKARALDALMQHRGYGGTYVPITPDAPQYQGALDGLHVIRLRVERVEAKRKLGQNRSARAIASVLEGLWQRGGEGDLEAIERVRRYHPADPCPARLAAPEGLRLHVAPREEHAAQVAGLLEGQYWTEGTTAEQRAGSQLGAAAWILFADTKGEAVASARAITDGHTRAWILDVVVAEGVGHALMERMLDHPRIREVTRVALQTRDAHGFYASHGFVRDPQDPRRMLRVRA